MTNGEVAKMNEAFRNKGIPKITYEDLDRMNRVLKGKPEKKPRKKKEGEIFEKPSGGVKNKPKAKK